MRTRVISALALAVAALGMSAASAEAVPPNASYPVPGPYHVPLDTTYFQQNTSDAGVQPGEPTACGGVSMTKTVWFHLTGAGSSVRISTEDGFTTYDTVVAVYEAKGDGTPGTLVDCGDDTQATYKSDLRVPLAAGREYLVQIGGCDRCTARGGGFTPDS